MPPYFSDPNEPEPDPVDPNDPRVQEFQRGEDLRQGALNATSVADWIKLLRSIPNPSEGEAQLLAEIEANPNAYEAGRQGSGGALRKKSKLDFIGNHPWLTAAAFMAGAAAPALLGGGGTLASSSLPTASLMGGPAAITSGAVSTGLGTGAALTGAGSTVAGLLPSSSIPAAAGVLPSGSLPAVTGSAPNITSQAASSGGGFWNRAGGAIKNYFTGNRGTTGDVINNLLGAAGRGISGATEASANNRGVQLLAEMEAAKLRDSQKNNYESQLISRSVDDRDSLTDAFTKSVQANRVFNSKGYQPGMLAQGPGSERTPLPTFGTGMAAPTDQMKSNAQSLYDEVAKRLTGGSQLPALEAPKYYENDPSLLKPGAGERIGNWLGPGLDIFSAYNRGISGDPNEPDPRRRR